MYWRKEALVQLNKVQKMRSKKSRYRNQMKLTHLQMNHLLLEKLIQQGTRLRHKLSLIVVKVQSEDLLPRTKTPY